MSWLGAQSKELERAAVKLAILAAMLAPRALAAESPKTRTASHRLQVKLTKGETGRLVTQFAEPYSPATGQYDVQIRCAFGASGRGRLQLLVDGAAQGAAWEAKAVAGWVTHTVKGVSIRAGSQIAIDAAGPDMRIDYVQLGQ